MPSPERRTQDRRTGDRRSGSNRTEDGEAYDGEERREGEDRRAGEERRRAERKNLSKIALYGLAGGLAPVALILFLNHYQEPVHRPRGGSRTLDYEIEEVAKVDKPKAKAAKEEEKISGVESLREDLLNLAPDLYHAVKLESLISKTDPNAVDSTATVEAIEFEVKAKRWHEMVGGDKVAVLNRTFDFLKNTFPNLTRTVRLIFDDGRPDLDLRFD